MAAWKGQFAVAAWQSLSLLANISDAHCSVTGNYWPLSTCDLWMAPLIGVKEGRGICSNSVTKFYDSNGFLTSIFPNHSSEAWTKIIWYRLCFYHNTWHQDKKKRGGQSSQRCIVLCAFDISGHAHLSSAEGRNLRSTLGFVHHPVPLSPPGRIFFFPGFLRLCLGGLRDEKEGKKSPLVSAPQKHHPEPSCHPTWIKGPSVVAAELLTWCLTLGRGVGGGRGWSRG